MSLLSSQQRQRYEEDGYLILPNLLNDRDLAPVRRAIMRHVDQEAKRLSSEGEIQDLHERLSFTRRLKEVYRSLKKEPSAGIRKYSAKRFMISVCTGPFWMSPKCWSDRKYSSTATLGTYKAAGRNRAYLSLASGQRLLRRSDRISYPLSLDTAGGCG